eukprot:15469775-Alexandrium_andersonii.AAC.1
MRPVVVVSPSCAKRGCPRQLWEVDLCLAPCAVLWRGHLRRLHGSCCTASLSSGLGSHVRRLALIRPSPAAARVSICSVRSMRPGPRPVRVALTLSSPCAA